MRASSLASVSCATAAGWARDEALHAGGDATGQDQYHRSDSRNVKTPRGWVQGYNAQAVTNERQIVIAAELTNSLGQLGPMVDAARRELAAAGVQETPQTVVADAGYWHQIQMQALAVDGPAGARSA